jgi:hypothetical protein
MQPPSDMSITVKEAARRIGYSVRQTDRFIKQGLLEAVHVTASLRAVSVASVETFNAQRGRHPIDPLEPIKDTLHRQEQVTGDILRQVALLRSELLERHATLQQRISDLESQVRLFKVQLQQEREARQGLEHAVAALAPMTGAEENEQESERLRQFFMHLPRPSQRGRLPQEKRGYSADTIRLVHFAVQHGIEPSTLRQHAERMPGLVTIYERPQATTKKREWWLTPAQQAPLLHSWQAQRKAWMPAPIVLMRRGRICLHCPMRQWQTGRRRERREASGRFPAFRGHHCPESDSGRFRDNVCSREKG